MWFTIAEAVVAGKLGCSAKVSSRSERPSHVICVYTKDFSDETDVKRVEKAIRELGIHYLLQYKSDMYTCLNIYKMKNDLGITPFIYTSKSVSPRKPSQQKPEKCVRKKYNFSFAQQFM